MIVTVRGEEYACRTAMKKGSEVILFLGKYDSYGREMTATFIDFPEEDIVGVENVIPEVTTEDVLNTLLGVRE